MGSTAVGGESQNSREFTGIFYIIDWEFKAFNSKWHKNILLCLTPVFELGFYAWDYMYTCPNKNMHTHRASLLFKGGRPGGAWLRRHSKIVVIVSNKQNCETSSFLFCLLCFLELLLGEIMNFLSCWLWGSNPQWTLSGPRWNVNNSSWLVLHL